LPAEPLSHLIHTLTIFMIFIAVLAIFQAYTLFTYTDALKHQLTDIANYVGSIALDLVALTSRSKFENITLYKTLNLPSSVGTYGYTVELEEKNGHYFVVVYLDAKPSVRAECELPLQDIACVGFVHSGSRLPILYCSRVSNGDGSYNITLRLEG